VARSSEAPASAAASGQASRSTLFVASPLLLLILVDAVGFAMLTPLLASALAEGSGAAIQVGLSPTQRPLVYGIGTGIYPIMTFVGAPILGQLSDRLGRKTILLVCAVGIVASYITISAAFALGSVALLMVGRFVGGATAASQAVSLAALVDASPPRHKDFWLSMGLLCSSSGFVLGPALSGFLSDAEIMPWFSLLTPLYVTALVAAINVLMLAWLFHDRGRRVAAAAPFTLLSGVRSFVSAFSRPGALRDVSWVFLLQELAWGAYFYFIPVFLLDRYSASGRVASYFMSVMGVGFCLSFAVAMPLLTKFFSTRAITFWSLVATAALIAVSALAPSMSVQWVVILPISVATAVSYGALIILFTDTATEETKGEVMGITAAINSLSFGSISVLGGGLEELAAGSPIFVALALMTLSALVFGLQILRSSTQRGA